MTELTPRRGPGQPTKLTAETAARIIDYVRAGNYLKIAAQAAGIGQSTLALWLARGREATSAREQHNEDHRYCPDCDLDREADATAVERHNALVDAEPDAPGEQASLAYAVLARCSRCYSEAYPVLWQLPDTEARYLEFLESVTRAQAAAETSAVVAWRKAFPDDWRAARDYLARTSPERWAGVTRVQMTTEEAERRIDDAVNEALLAVGIDLPTGDPIDDALDEGLDP